MRVLLISDSLNLPKLISSVSNLKPSYVEAMTNADSSVGVDKLLVLRGAVTNDCWVDAASERAKGFDLILLPATRDMREVASRIAARLGLPYASGVTQVSIESGKIRASKLCFGGRGLEVLSAELPSVLSLDLSGFEPSLGSPKSKEDLEAKCDQRVRVLERREKVAEVDLSKAEVIVSVGRGLKRKEDLEMIRKLANLLKAEIACTRPISADLKWLPEERHVGMTGVRVRPRLYLALGISGQIQHVVGFRDAETVIAVNTDAEAPIGEVSDYFVVSDLYAFVPKLIEALERK
ncbi:MAG: electron transfer flavoprotein subunit alpha/FixB family protein [Candidatus Korarchaeum sp.]